MTQSSEVGRVPGMPSAEEQKNVVALDEMADALFSAELRPRRWISRIGALLRHAREQRQLNQAAMAMTADVTQAYLSRLENGLVPKRGPTIDVLLRCAEAADCDLEISLRSKKSGKQVGVVTSAELDQAGAGSNRSGWPEQVVVSVKEVERAAAWSADVSSDDQESAALEHLGSTSHKLTR